MQNCILITLLLALSTHIWANELSPTTKITVFTTENYPIARQELAQHIYYLDAVEKLEESTSQLFSDKPQLAAEQAKAWLKTDAGKTFEQQLQQAYIGVTEGWKQGVMKVPAVLFQEGSQEAVVIYGESNVAKALQLYRRNQEP